MSRLQDAPSLTEGLLAAREQVRGDVSGLRTARGFVVGGVLSGAIWGLLGLFIWYIY